MGMRIDVVEGGKIAVLALRANRLRTLLTTVGIGIGVCTLLAIVGIIQGLNASFAQQLSSLGGNSMYVTKFPWIMRGDFYKYRNRRELTPPLAEQLRELPEVSAVAPMTFKTDEVKFANVQLANVRVQGTTADFPSVAGWEVTSGRFLSGPENDNSSAVAVLGADVADGLFPTANPIGQSIRIGSRPFRVIGVLARKGKILGQNQDLAIQVPLRTFLAAFGSKRQLTIGVAATPGVDLLRAQDQVEIALRRARGVAPEKDSDFSINRPEQLANTYAQLTGALYGVALGVGLITLLVGGIGIMNVMLVSVRERTREIGVRRALGARRRTIVLQFLLEAAGVSAIGGTVGTLLGLGLAKVVSMATPLAAAVQPATIAGGIGFAAAVGLVFGIWPAFRAAQLDPVEALRYE
ncbi:MAG: FtsX-like permease family protein [Myxococcaceae bacterium]|nr:MAG: FtsX-like permease family protein [Myxococcaceae bacterium]